MSSELGDDFQTAFWAATHALSAATAAAFCRHGAHAGQQFILRCLWAQDGLTPGEIAKRLGLATPTVTRATARMEAAGLLHRKAYPGDRRLVRLMLTERARSLGASSPPRRTRSPSARLRRSIRRSGRP